MYAAEKETGLPLRFAWAMLPTVCDRDGRFRWKPHVLKLDVLPFDELDFSRVLDAWLTRGFIVKYRVGNEWYGWLPTFLKHQSINNKEIRSEIPPVDDADEAVDYRNQQDGDACSTRDQRATDAKATPLNLSQGEGKGREGKGDSPEQSRVESPEFIRLPILGKVPEAIITEADVAEWERTFPAVDVRQELRECRQWNLDNPRKRKTATGWRSHVSRWMAKVQDRGGTRSVGHAASGDFSGAI